MSGDGRREREQRHARLIKGRISKPGSASFEVLVRNVSRSGMGIKSSSLQLAVGETVSIDLAIVGWVEGVVSWVHSDNAGVRLNQEIDPQALRFSSHEVVDYKQEPFQVHDRFRPEISTWRPGFGRR